MTKKTEVFPVAVVEVARNRVATNNELRLVEAGALMGAPRGSASNLNHSALGAETKNAVDRIAKLAKNPRTAALYETIKEYWFAWYKLRRPTILEAGPSDPSDDKAWLALEEIWASERLSYPVHVNIVTTFITDHTLHTRVHPAAKPEDVKIDGSASEASTASQPASVPRRRKSGVAGPQTGSLEHNLPADVDEALRASGKKAKLGPFKLTTLELRLAALSKIHSVDDHHPNPCKDPAIRNLLKDLRTTYANRKDKRKTQTALTADLLRRLLDTCDNSLKGRRDRALLLFAWSSGGRRRSEVQEATIEDLRPTEDGFTFHLGRSKTNPEAEDRPEDHKPLEGEAAVALDDWLRALRAAQITTGPIFRRVSTAGRIGVPLTSEGVRSIVKARCAAAELPGSYSAHSLRSGFVTEAGRRDLSAGVAMAMTGHKSAKVFQGYYQVGRLSKSPHATMMDSTPSKAARRSGDSLLKRSDSDEQDDSGT